MRLTWRDRLLILALSLVVLAVAFLRLGRTQLPTAFLVVLLIFGLGALVVVLVGVLPGGNWKDFHLKWPEADLLERVDHWEKRANDLAWKVATMEKDHAEQIAELTAANVLTRTMLEEFILAHEPSPIPDDSDPEEVEVDLDEEDLLLLWERNLHELSDEISSRYMTGEYYDDGIGVEELERVQTKARARVEHERARQKARSSTRRG